MVRSFFIVLVISSSIAQADLFDFGDKDSGTKIVTLMDKIKALKMNDGPEFEALFNQNIQGIENALEEDKRFCAGESVNKQGKTLPASQKQFCMRELKKHYLDATVTIFEVKKKYLEFIHQTQIRKLSEIQIKLKADIEKNF